MTSPSRRPMGYRRWLQAGAIRAAYSLRHPGNGNRFRMPILTGIAALLLLLTLTSAALPSFAQPGPPEPAAQPLLQPGSSGPPVKQIQQELAQRRFYRGEVDGIYGAETAEAVRSLQRQRGLTVDGVVGVETWQALASQTVVMPLPTLLQADLLTLTPLVVAAPPPPPSSLWLALMPLVPISGGLLTYLCQRFQRRQQLRRRRSQRRLPPNSRLPR